MVICSYFFQGGAEEESMSAMNLPHDPVLLDVKKNFPFIGTYHFRAKINLANGSFAWLDLLHDTRSLPTLNDGMIVLKVLQLSTKSNGHTKLLINQQTEYQFQQQLNPPETTTTPTNKPATLFGSMMKGIMGSKKTVKKYFQTTDDLPTEAAAAQLSTIVVLFTTPFSTTNPYHIDVMQRLWHSVQINTPFEKISPKWKELGFQETDPSLDLRGMLSLECLLYFLNIHRPIALTFIHERTYPFAAVGVNITLTIVDILDIQTTTYLQRSEQYWKVFEDPAGFYKVYCIAFQAFDCFWTEEQATRKDFPRILERTKRHIYDILQLGPMHIEKLVHSTYKH